MELGDQFYKKILTGSLPSSHLVPLVPQSQSLYRVMELRGQFYGYSVAWVLATAAWQHHGLTEVGWVGGGQPLPQVPTPHIAAGASSPGLRFGRPVLTPWPATQPSPRPAV